MYRHKFWSLAIIKISTCISLLMISLLDDAGPLWSRLARPFSSLFVHGSATTKKTEKSGLAMRDQVS